MTEGTIAEFFSEIATKIFPEPIFVLILVFILIAIALYKSKASLPVAGMLGFFLLYSYVSIGFGNAIWNVLYYVIIAIGGGLVIYGILKIARK